MLVPREFDEGHASLGGFIMNQEMSPKVDSLILTTLKRLGYRNMEVRKETLHARRGADHLIIKLTKKGGVKEVSAHRDTPGKALPFAYKHKTVKGEVGSKLAKEFKTIYRQVRIEAG